MYSLVQSRDDTHYAATIADVFMRRYVFDPVELEAGGKVVVDRQKSLFE